MEEHEVLQNYKLAKTLGSGSFGRVKRKFARFLYY